MTLQENYGLSLSTVVELTRNGLEVIPELVRVILNNVMQAERTQYLQAKAYERTEERKGYANGYMPKRVRTKLGDSPLPFHKYEKVEYSLQQYRRE